MSKSRLFSDLLLVLALTFPVGEAFALSDRFATSEMTANFEYASLDQKSGPKLKSWLKAGSVTFKLQSISQESSEPPLTLSLEPESRNPKGFRLAFPRDIPVGYYNIVASRNGKDLPISLGFEINPPSVDNIHYSNNGELLLTVTGSFFGQEPTAELVFNNASGTPETKVGTPLPDSYQYKKGASKAVMDEHSGASGLTFSFSPEPNSASPLDENPILLLRTSSGSVECKTQKFQLDITNESPGRGNLVCFSKKASIDFRSIYSFVMDSVAGAWYKLPTRLIVNTWLYSDDGIREMIDNTGDPVTGWNLELYNIVYSSTDQSDKPAPASGVVIVPVSPRETEKRTSLDLMAFIHGTMVLKKEAPTLSSGPELGFSALYAAADGRVVVVPDHLGLGMAAEPIKTLYHPYCQSTPNARTDGDMIPAVKQLFEDARFKALAPSVLPLNKKLYLTGFSEGGYLTLALHHELEKNPQDYGFARDSLPVTASTPMEGPYSLSEAMISTLMKAKADFPAPYFAPYLLVTLDNNYKFGGGISNYMATPYQTTIPPLVNGYNDSEAINKAMPKIVKAFLTKESQKAFDRRKPDESPMYQAIVSNDLVKSGINIKSPLLLVHGSDDDLVPHDNADAEARILRPGEVPSVLSTIEGRTKTQWVMKNLGGVSYHASYLAYAVGRSRPWLNTQ